MIACACGPGPDGGVTDADATGTTAGPDSDATGASSGATTGPDAPTTGDPIFDEPAPDCAMLSLPGDPAELALTPRSDQDAEVLALLLDSSRVTARQADYEVVHADLEAIRALDPPLAEVHAPLEYTRGLTFWFFGAPLELMFAMYGGEYHGWDCHDAHYGAGPPRMVDGIGFGRSLDGVYSEAVDDAYRAIPSLADVEIYRCCDAACSWGTCDADPAGVVTLVATTDGEALLTREYTFTRPEHPDGDRIYVVEPGGEPVRVE